MLNNYVSKMMNNVYGGMVFDEDKVKVQPSFEKDYSHSFENGDEDANGYGNVGGISKSTPSESLAEILNDLEKRV